MSSSRLVDSAAHSKMARRTTFCIARNRPEKHARWTTRLMSQPAGDSAAGEKGTKLAVAVLGGGCFWCTEAIFLEAPGVMSVTPGYAGGKTDNPTYQQVISGKTGHAEVIRVEFDPSVVTLAQVYDLHMSTHDATQINRQGADVGTQYRSTIMVSSGADREAAMSAIARAKEALQGEKLFGIFGGNGKIATTVEECTAFYAAENYHKDYYAKNPGEPYCMMRITPKLQSYKVRSSLRQLREAVDAA
jgi:peptide-methionine (S)-S-oxide reductase